MTTLEQQVADTLTAALERLQFKYTEVPDDINKKWLVVCDNDEKNPLKVCDNFADSQDECKRLYMLAVSQAAVEAVGDWFDSEMELPWTAQQLRNQARGGE